MKLTREQAYNAIKNNGIVLHPCNKEENNNGSIFYLSNNELLSLLNDECHLKVDCIYKVNTTFDI